MFLELSFEYDTNTKVLVYLDAVENKLKVFGLCSCDEYRYGIHRPDGGMVGAFYEYANVEVLRNTDGSAGDFCSQLSWAFKQVLRGAPLPTWLSAWLDEINPYVEGLSPNEPSIRTGAAIRFYREDGPRGSWVWKDTIKDISALLRPCPVRVER